MLVFAVLGFLLFHFLRIVGVLESWNFWCHSAIEVVGCLLHVGCWNGIDAECGYRRWLVLRGVGVCPGVCLFEVVFG